MTDHIDWRLPSDLEFIIIDYFLDDKVTLASCALVCSRWLIPSAANTYSRTVTIKSANHDLSPDPLVDFLKVVEHSEGVNSEWAFGKNLKRFKLEETRVS